MVYGESADKDILEKAVRWVIITIIFVFDPLAVLLLIASQYTLYYIKPDDVKPVIEDTVEPVIEDTVEPVIEDTVNNKKVSTADMPSEKSEQWVNRNVI